MQNFVRKEPHQLFLNGDSINGLNINTNADQKDTRSRQHLDNLNSRSSSILSVPDCTPLKTLSSGLTINYFDGASMLKQSTGATSFKTMSRNYKINDIVGQRSFIVHDSAGGSIFKKVHNENSRNEYANLLRSVVPDLYRPGNALYSYTSFLL